MELQFTTVQIIAVTASFPSIYGHSDQSLLEQMRKLTNDLKSKYGVRVRLQKGRSPDYPGPCTTRTLCVAWRSCEVRLNDFHEVSRPGPRPVAILSAVVRDIHFWVPVVVLILGLVLLRWVS